MKGQRVISSFFTRKAPPAGPHASKGQPTGAKSSKPQRAAPADPPQHDDTIDIEDSPVPPAKRQRISAKKNAAGVSKSSQTASALPPALSPTPSPSGHATVPSTTSKAHAVMPPDSKHENNTTPPSNISPEPCPLSPAEHDSPAENDGIPSLSTKPCKETATSSKDNCTPKDQPKLIPPRDALRQRLAHRKLVESRVQEETRKAAPTQGTAAVKYTPLEQQVVQLKKQYPGTVLIVEVGYKMRFFGEDAEIASKVCNIYCYPDHNFLTASVPVIRLPIHVRRLVQAGYKVGVVRQTETAAIKACGSNRNAPFERKLTALYTSATLEAGEKADKLGEEDAMEVSQELDAALGSASASRYLVCLAEDAPDAEGAGMDSKVAVVAVDTSTGQVVYGVCKSGHVASELESAMLKLEPSEVIIMEPLTTHTEKLLASYIAATPGCRLERKPGVPFLDDTVVEKVTAFYGASGEKADSASDAAASNLAAVMEMEGLMLRALSLAVEYLSAFGLQGVLQDVGSFTPLTGLKELALSSNAFRQLEILQAGEDGRGKSSLLHLMNQTRTAMGSRLLRSWLSRPLTDRAAILQRQDAVRELAESQQAGGPLAALEPLLRRLPDLEKGVTRIFHKTAAPAEFVQILQALSRLGDKLPVVVKKGEVVVNGVSSLLLCSLLKTAASPTVSNLCQELLGCIDVKAAHHNNYLDMFSCRNRFADVHRCKADVKAAEKHLQDLLPSLAKAARVPRLDYITIQNQGEYLIELPTSGPAAPSGWEKVCSTKKFHRWHPPEVKKGIQALELAKEHLQAACATSWNDFLGSFSQHYNACKAAIQALAHVDVLHSLSKLVHLPGYCRPEFVEDDEGPVLDIKGGRHPMLDAAMSGNAVPNDVDLSWSGCRSYIVTGPNMGGKSVFIRQTAVLVIMAQIGSFVPAESARLHVVDGIFTRMGASDNLMLGRSTFQEELGDAADTLDKATSRSLVIMDELGRGTATHDGVAIAVATLEHLVAKIRCLALFVTHYPEVACLEDKYPGAVRSFHMAYAQESPNVLVCKDDNVSAGDATPPKIVFLYKLTPGVADQSFGLNVAGMAGLPAQLVQRAAVKASEMHDKIVSTRHCQQAQRQLVDIVNKLVRSVAGAAPGGADKTVVDEHMDEEPLESSQQLAVLQQLQCEAGTPEL